ncbi:hypothetical protein FRUB_04745 [Fimbriiglobus ruber]|uniref:Uncharacterized protein n=1 Tax=Fimbriiglobus ruber TaxID=1908690 RepID=A0A225DIQ4_9BACT|nr:hypothetical protein FRUB_04745 [Fimbriiglobus ruber]
MPDALRAEWAECAELAKRNPHPAVYTPVAWWRYRELLLRYEQATAVPDAVGAGKLKIALDAARGEIERGLGLALDSQNYSLPLGTATGRPWAAAGPVARALTQARTLDQAADGGRAALGGITQAPVEVHLPVMLRHFVKEVLKPDTADVLGNTWEPAVKARVVAERAAFGVRADAAGHPYSERVWPFVRTGADKADEFRRQGEDWTVAASVYGPKYAQDAAEAFRKAEAGYDQALQTAARVQAALQVRDDALAELPFLTRWLTEAEVTSDKAVRLDLENDRLLDAWQKALALSDLVDRATADPGRAELGALDKATKAAAEPLAELRQVVAKEVQFDWRADTQANWLAVQHLLLLPPPLIGIEDRERLFDRGRLISRKLTETQTEAAGEARVTAGQKAVRRLKAAAESLGGSWGNWAREQPSFPGKPRTDLISPDRYLLADTADLSAILYAHRHRQADFDKYPATGSADRDAAEAFSRLAVPFTQFPVPEPAVVGGLARWKGLLEWAAARAARDHWYDEAGQPYLRDSESNNYPSRKLGPSISRNHFPSSASRVTCFSTTFIWRGERRMPFL